MWKNTAGQDRPQTTIWYGSCDCVLDD